MDRFFINVKRPFRTLVAIVTTLAMVVAGVATGAQPATAANPQAVYW